MSKGNNNDAEIKKFKIKELLDELPYNRRKKARVELIGLMEVSLSTFERILYAKENENQELSATNLFRVAHFFTVDPSEIMSNALLESVLATEST